MCCLENFRQLVGVSKLCFTEDYLWIKFLLSFDRQLEGIPFDLRKLGDKTTE